MPHPAIADHDPAMDDRDHFVTPRGGIGAGRSADFAGGAAPGAPSGGGGGYAAPHPPAVRGGRGAASSFSGGSAGDGAFSAAAAGAAGDGGSRARGGAGHGGPPAARAPSSFSKSRGLKVRRAHVYVPLGLGCAPPLGGPRADPLPPLLLAPQHEDAEEPHRGPRPHSGLSMATVDGGAAAAAAAAASAGGYGAPSGPMVAVPLASLPLVCGGGGGSGGGGEPPQMFGLPTALLTMAPADGCLPDAGGAPFPGPPQSAAAQAQAAAAVAQGMAAGPIFAALPLPGSSSGYVMGEIMELCDPMGQAMGGPVAMALPLPLPRPMPQGGPDAAAAAPARSPFATAPPSPYAGRAPPSPLRGDGFASLQARLAPVRTRLQQGWPDDAGGAQVSSAPAGAVNAMLGPCGAGAAGSDDGGGFASAPQALGYASGPLLSAGGCTSSGGTPTMGGGTCCGVPAGGAAAAAPFARFAGPAAAARFADGSTEPSPTASIGRGVAGLGMDSCPGTPPHGAAATAAATPGPLLGSRDVWADAPAVGGAFYGAGPAAGAAPGPAPGAPQADDGFLDDPVLAGLWTADGGVRPLPAAGGRGAVGCGGPPPPASMEMQQVTAQLAALQQQQAALQKQFMVQQAVQMALQQQAAAAAAASPRSGGDGAGGAPPLGLTGAVGSPVSRERLLNALSAQISAMSPEMRAQLQAQLEATAPAPAAPAAASSAAAGGMLHGPSRLSAAAAMPAPPPRDVGSPLKRGLSVARSGSLPLGGGPPDDGGGSPLKRLRGLPEPPSFATLVQAEMGTDEAVAWALRNSFCGVPRGPDGRPLMAVASDDTLGRLADPDTWPDGPVAME
jgi:hypothetical protein